MRNETVKEALMKLFRLPKHKPGNMAGETPLMCAVRYIIIGLLFAGAVWGFWANSRKITETMKRTATERADCVGSLSGGQQQRATGFSAMPRDADDIAS
jgi:hypothetical protein